MDTHPMQREKISGLMGTISTNLMTDKQMLEKIRQVGTEIVQARDKESAEAVHAIATAKAMAKQLYHAPHLSAGQRAALENNSIEDGASLSDSISALTNLCQTFAEEGLHLRSQSRVIVGDEHAKLKKTESNVIAGDVSWSSKQIMNSLDPLIKRMQQEFPDMPELAALNERVKQIRNGKVIDFFEAIGVMEDGLRLVTKLQGRRNNAESDYLKTFQTHLKNMHCALEEGLKNNIAFQSGSEKEREAFTSLLKGFKDASEQEDDPVKLRKLISDNVNHMSSSFQKVMARQDLHIRQQHRALDALRVDVRQKSLKNEQIEAQHTALLQELAASKNESLIDPLTQSMNRRAYDLAIEAIDKKGSHGAPLDRCGVIVLDIDHFKKINDNHGHSVGDRMLKAVSFLVRKALESREHLKDSTTLYRYGGEEFALLYQNLDIQEAARLADQLRRLIEKQSYKLKDQVLQISVSVGVSYYRSPRMLGEQVFDEADRAMYVSKKQGRNRVSLLYGDKFVTLQKNEPQAA